MELVKNLSCPVTVADGWELRRSGQWPAEAQWTAATVFIGVTNAQDGRPWLSTPGRVIPKTTVLSEMWTCKCAPRGRSGRPSGSLLGVKVGTGRAHTGLQQHHVMGCRCDSGGRAESSGPESLIASSWMGPRPGDATPEPGDSLDLWRRKEISDSSPSWDRPGFREAISLCRGLRRQRRSG